jgi:hypothetical protein
MSEPIRTAETYICEQTALYRHYHIAEVRRIVRQFTGVGLSNEQAIEIVQGIRDEHGLGPIREYNLPGYEEGEA